jgi:hypothetical protein
MVVKQLKETVVPSPRPGKVAAIVRLSTAPRLPMDVVVPNSGLDVEQLLIRQTTRAIPSGLEFPRSTPLR